MLHEAFQKSPPAWLLRHVSACLDARHLPAPDALVGTEECIRTVHRDRCVVDCADAGMQIDWKLLGAPRFMWDPTVGRGDPDQGSHSDKPFEEPSEPAPPPHTDTMDSAGPAGGMGIAADSGLPEGVGLMGTDKGPDEGAAPGSGGAEAAPAGGFEPPEVGQFLRTPTRVCLPAAPLRKNPLNRKRLVPACAAVCAMDALASNMDTLTVCDDQDRCP